MFMLDILFALWMLFASGNAITPDGSPPPSAGTMSCGEAGGALDPDGNCVP